MASLPRGVRNRNPGNIDYNARNKWEGLDDPPSDGRFCRFKTDEHGIRALVILLRNYRKKYGLRSIEQIINRWAPPTENNTGAYARAVAKRFGEGVDYEPDLDDLDEVELLVRAITQHENGKGPYDGDWYTDTVFRRGIRMAIKPLPRSRTMQGSAVAGGATAAQGLMQVVTDNVDQAQSVAMVFDLAWPEIARYVLLAVALGGIAFAMWAKYSDRKEALG